MTGTIGNITDESLLKKNYNVNIFKIPRNKTSKKPIYNKPIPYELKEIYSSLIQKVLQNNINERLVLIILDSPKHI